MTVRVATPRSSVKTESSTFVKASLQIRFTARAASFVKDRGNNFMGNPPFLRFPNIFTILSGGFIP